MVTIRQSGVRILKYGIGILALAWLLQQIRLQHVVNLSEGIDLRTFLLVVVVSGVGLGGRFYTWHALCNRFQRTKFVSSANIDLILSFVNQLLPSRLSGRAVAPFVVRSESGMEYPESVAIAGVNTGLYAVFYGIISLFGLFLVHRQFSLLINSIIFVSAVLYLGAGTVVLFAGAYLDKMDALVERFGVSEQLPIIGDQLSVVIEKFPSFSEASADCFNVLLHDGSVLFRYGLGWVIDKFAGGLRVWVLLLALGAGFDSVILLPVYLVMAYSVTLLPLTPGGVGVTEATATAVFVALGVPTGVIVPVVVIDRVLGVYLPAVFGWYPTLQTDFSALTSE